jgi:hypothetical protein
MILFHFTIVHNDYAISESLYWYHTIIRKHDCLIMVMYSYQITLRRHEVSKNIIEFRWEWMRWTNNARENINILNMTPLDIIERSVGHVREIMNMNRLHDFHQISTNQMLIYSINSYQVKYLTYLYIMSKFILHNNILR